MARCSMCHGEFEGAKQANCPLCGAARPRPRLRIPEAAPDVTATLQALRVAPEPPKPKKRRRREEAAMEPPTPDVPAPVTVLRPAPAPVDGPPPIEVEYVFGGPQPDEITLVTTIAVLDPPELEQADGASGGRKVFGRTLRKRTA